MDRKPGKPWCRIQESQERCIPDRKARSPHPGLIVAGFRVSWPVRCVVRSGWENVKGRSPSSPALLTQPAIGVVRPAEQSRTKDTAERMGFVALVRENQHKLKMKRNRPRKRRWECSGREAVRQQAGAHWTEKGLDNREGVLGRGRGAAPRWTGTVVWGRGVCAKLLREVARGEGCKKMIFPLLPTCPRRDRTRWREGSFLLQ